MDGGKLTPTEELDILERYFVDVFTCDTVQINQSNK